MSVRQLTEEETEYVQNIVNKFNANREDPDLSSVEQILLGKYYKVELEVTKLTEEANGVVEEAKKKQEELINLNQRISHARSQSSAFLDSLLSLRG